MRWRFNGKPIRVLSNKPESKKVTNEGALHGFLITYNVWGGGLRDGSCALEYKMSEFRVKRKRQQCKNREQ